MQETMAEPDVLQRRATPRVAVVGLYNSGSSAVAGMLHRLGVFMGPPFWNNSRELDPENHYESHDLAWHLRQWWQEPKLIESMPPVRRRAYLKKWVELQETLATGPVGAKHPLLAMCLDDLSVAWGDSLHIVRIGRPLPDSLAGLVRRRWFPGFEQNLQLSILSRMETHLAKSSAPLLSLEWGELCNDPVGHAERLCNFLGIERNRKELESAAKIVGGLVPRTPAMSRP